MSDRRPDPNLEVNEAPGGAAYLLHDQVGFLLRVATQRAAAIFASRMIEGLTPPQFATLAKLREIGPCSQNRLGRLVFLDAATIKGVVDRLSARGFVIAADDPKDRRRRALALTDAGLRVTNAAIEVAYGITEATLAPLTPEERVTICRLLKKLG
ncbi:MarR family transcriptional regulator [Bosea sp. 117]|uniref:MarR family winged helix-turn-helix transcriptional regulator n=1 Tax=Bosea sp. 117 TaxID=1125973 RepID=UPI0005707371|nr:MarR family transcriptional regulator [Bosea sp. 117]